MSKIKFSDDNVFLALEEQAIDGQLDYSEFPPEEYKYFSKLAKLGYLNRHKGWSAEICEQKQEEFREQYRIEKEREKKIFKETQRITHNRIRCGQAVAAVYKAADINELMKNALTALEMLLDEPGLKYRIDKKLTEEHKKEV